MIDAENVREDLVVNEPFHFLLLDTKPAEVIPHRGVWDDLSAQQIESQPAPLVLKLGLISKCRRTECLAQIFGLN